MKRLACVLLAALATGTPLAAQAVDRLHVQPEPAGTMVAVTLRLGAGRAVEARTEAGVLQLAALTVLENLRPALDSVGARATVACGRGATTFTLLAPSDTWGPAAMRMLAGVFHPEPDSLDLERARARLVRSTRLDNGNPTWQVRVVTRQALFGITHPLARPECGLPETLELLSRDSVLARAERWFRPARATVAVHGPVDEGAARAWLAPRLHLATPPADGMGPVATRDSARAAERNTITAWVGLAFPFGDDGDEEALRLLALRIRDAVRPGPDRPGVLGLATELEHHPGGGALYVYFLTDPERALPWADRVRTVVDRTAARPLSPAVIAALIRRHRGERLRELATPEARARRTADTLAQGRRPTGPHADMDGLSASRLQRAAASLGAPALGVIGPEQLVKSVTP